MAVVISTEILVSFCQGTQCYNVEDYSMTGLKTCNKRKPREIFGIEENKQHNGQ
jgi:hypothetical protein